MIITAGVYFGVTIRCFCVGTLNEILLPVPPKTWLCGTHDDKLVRSRLDGGPSSSRSKNKSRTANWHYCVLKKIRWPPPNFGEEKKMHALALVSGSRCLPSPSPTPFLHANAKSRSYSSRPFCRCSVRKQNRQSLSKTWPSISLALFSAGFFLGPLIDGLHSRVNLVVYENGSINFGPLHTNIWVLSSTIHHFAQFLLI